MHDDMSHLSMEEISVGHCARCLCRTPDVADRIELASGGAGMIRAICVECFSEVAECWPWDPHDPSELWDRPAVELPEEEGEWWKRGQEGGREA
jgi:hypothetical protein